MPIRKVGKKWAVVKKIHRVFPTKGAAMRFEAQHSAAIAKVEQLGPTEKTCCTIRDKEDTA